MSLSDQKHLNPSPDMWSDNSSYTFGMQEVLAILRRSIGTIIAGALLGLALAGVLLAVKKPAYTATTTIQLENFKARSFEKAYSSDNNSSTPLETDLRTEIEVIKSDRIAERVLDTLDKGADTPTAQLRKGSAPHIKSAHVLEEKDLVTAALPPEAAAPEAGSGKNRLAATASLRSALTVRQIPQATVLELSFTDQNPARAAELSKAFAAAYIDAQQQYKNEVVDQVTAWLRTQISEIKQLVQRSDQEIEKFKTDRGIISASGGLLNDQRLSDAHNRLITARAETGRLQARQAKLQAAIQEKAVASVIGDGSIDPLVAQLRMQYLAIVREEKDVGSKLGTQHASVLRLRSNREGYEQSILNELRRMADTSKSELEIAQSREAALLAEFNDLVKKNSEANSSQVELRELERPNLTYKAVYNGLLERYQEAVQRQELDNPNARIITEARIPTTPNGLAPALIAALCVFFGSVGGGGLGFIRNLSDKSIRTREQLRAETGTASSWMLPALGKKPARHVLAEPRSYAAGTLEAIKLELDRAAPGKGRVLGIVSCLPGAGATTLASNLALLIAQTGAKALLIDADLRQAALTQTFAPNAAHGIVEAAAGSGKTLEQHILPAKDEARLSVMPVGQAARVDHPASVLASAGMAALIGTAKDSYDYIVVDLPPIGLSIDADALAGRIDAFLLVVQWGKTPQTLLTETLDRYPGIRAKCLGVVINNTDMRKLRRYETINASAAYDRHYASFLSGPRAQRS